MEMEGIASDNDLSWAFQEIFSDSIAQRRLDAIFPGPDAPYLFYQGQLYFRDDVPCGPGSIYREIDWNSFAITRVIDGPDFQGIEFTLSGSQYQNGESEEKTWTFRLGEDETQLIRFQTWFDET